MAKKHTAPKSSRTASTTQTYDTNRFLALYFFTLIQEALEQLQKADRQHKELEAARYVHRLLKQRMETLHRIMNPPNALPLGDRIEAERAVKVLKSLCGFMDGFPKSHAAVARDLGISEKQVQELETRCFQVLKGQFAELFVTTRETWLRKHPCPYCSTTVGDVHKAGCQQEECPFCRNLLSHCFCAYKHLKIKWGGRTAKEWRALQKEHGMQFNPREHARPLTTEEERQWAAIVLQKGCIPYGSEQRFQ